MKLNLLKSKKHSESKSSNSHEIKITQQNPPPTHLQQQTQQQQIKQEEIKTIFENTLKIPDLSSTSSSNGNFISFFRTLSQSLFSLEIDKEFTSKFDNYLVERYHFKVSFLIN